MSHACIREAAIRGFTRSLRDRYVGSYTHFAGKFVRVNKDFGKSYFVTVSDVSYHPEALASDILQPFANNYSPFMR
jgi:hypothetical protein